VMRLRGLVAVRVASRAAPTTA
jgi:hypothetical protein